MQKQDSPEASQPDSLPGAGEHGAGRRAQLSPCPSVVGRCSLPCPAGTCRGYRDGSQAFPSHRHADSRRQPKSRPWRRRGTGRFEAFCAWEAQWKICKCNINMQIEGFVSDPPRAWLCSLSWGGRAGEAPVKLWHEAAARDRRLRPDVLITSSHF